MTENDQLKHLGLSEGEFVLSVAAMNKLLSDRKEAKMTYEQPPNGSTDKYMVTIYFTQGSGIGQRSQRCVAWDIKDNVLLCYRTIDGEEMIVFAVNLTSILWFQSEPLIRQSMQ